MENLKTGDLLLFNNTSGGFFGAFTSMIKWGTHSNYSHIAMILKDPTFIHPSLKGVYMWESGYEGTPDPQDDKIKLGVQITSVSQCINNFTGSVFVRKLESGKYLITKSKLTNIHHTVYDKPYDTDPIDWIEAYAQKDTRPNKTDKFWCSALIGYVVLKLGLIKRLDWSILRPVDFVSTSKCLKFNPGVVYGKETLLHRKC